MNKINNTTDNAVLSELSVALLPFSHVRKELTDHYMARIDMIKDEITAETIENKSDLWRYTDKNPIRFFICSPPFFFYQDKDKKDVEGPLHTSRIVTITPEDEIYSKVTITTSLDFDKASLKEESLKSLLADLDSKSFRLFMDKPDIFMSMPYVFSIELTDTDIVEVKIGMFVLDYHYIITNGYYVRD